MILNCNFEELRALTTGADLLLSEQESSATSGVAAPAEALAQVELLRPQLTGSLEIDTLAEQQQIRDAVALICEELHGRMDNKVLEFYPAHEEAVSLYFDYAHVYQVLARLDRMGTQMRAMIELMTGQPPTEASATSISFSD